MPASPILARVERDGFVESVHHGDLVVATDTGTVVAAHGDPDIPIYPRSALKPFQALAILACCDEAGVTLDLHAVAIACASHTGSSAHQVEVARLLALADLDEAALRCPAALPADLPTLLDQRERSALAHNCSGKHAGFLLAHTAGGGQPADYLDPDTPVQRAARERIAQACDATTEGPGVDGCGAPAWIMPLRTLATGFARLAAGALGRRGERVWEAMTTRPDLVGGRRVPDTRFMLADGRTLVKRGAEAVLAACFAGPNGPRGVAVKVADGGTRAAAPAVATALAALGAVVPDDLLAPTVLGGGRPHGAIHVVASFADRLP